MAEHKFKIGERVYSLAVATRSGARTMPDHQALTGSETVNSSMSSGANMKIISASRGKAS
jgi:hypothetical protein